MDSPENNNNKNSSRWPEYRLLLLSAFIGVVGGLGAQLFVWLLNWGERLLLQGIAGYTVPEAGVFDPVPVIGSHGLWLIPVATTLGGLLSGILVYTFAPEAEGHGTDAAVEFKKAKDRYTEEADRLRLDLLLVALEREAGRNASALHMLRTARTTYRHLPESAAVTAWLNILDPPPPPPAAPKK